jgi:hypothetical protein
MTPIKAPITTERSRRSTASRTVVSVTANSCDAGLPGPDPVGE